jgi:hypothetical protein
MAGLHTSELRNYRNPGVARPFIRAVRSEEIQISRSMLGKQVQIFPVRLADTPIFVALLVLRGPFRADGHLLRGRQAWTRRHEVLSLELDGHLAATGVDRALLY